MTNRKNETHEVDWNAFQPQEVATAAGRGTGTPKISLDDIPEAVKIAADKSYNSQDNALRFEFPSEEVKVRFLGLLRRYAELTEPRRTIRTFKDPLGAKDAEPDLRVLVFRCKDLEVRRPKQAD